MKYATALVLYLIFAIAAAIAGLVGLLGLPVDLLRGRGARHTANIMHSKDMLLAALLGWDGRATVSTECGREMAAGKPCRFCRIVCSILSYKILGRYAILEPDHCQKEAQE